MCAWLAWPKEPCTMHAGAHAPAKARCGPRAALRSGRTRSVGPDDGHAVALLNLQRDVLEQHPPMVAVREVADGHHLHAPGMCARWCEAQAAVASVHMAAT